MRISFYFSIAVLLLIVSMIDAAAQVSMTGQDVGEVYQANRIKSLVTIHNAGEKALRVVSMSGVREGDNVLHYTNQIPPNATIYAQVEIYTAGDLGDSTHTFRVVLEGSKSPVYAAYVHSFVVSALDQARPELDLGTVETDKTPVTKTITLTSREIPNFRITGILSTPDFVDAKLSTDGQSIEVTGKPSTAWGNHLGVLMASINSDVQPTVQIRLLADVHGDVISSQNPVDVGLIQGDTSKEYAVQVRSRNGKAFSIKSVDVTGMKAHASWSKCAGSEIGCVNLVTKFEGSQPAGRLIGRVTVHFAEYSNALPILFNGLALDKDSKIIPVSGQSQGEASAAAISTQLHAATLKDALHESVQKSSSDNAAAPEGHGPLLKWRTADEASIYGYLVYRSDSENGPFLKVTRETIRTNQNAGNAITSTYQWRDTSAEPGKTYWYYIGLINKDGTKQQLSGPQKVVAK